MVCNSSRIRGLLAAVLIFRWQMRLFQQRYFAVTAERNRISREWHDTLLAGFSAISLQLEAAMIEPGQTSARVREILECDAQNGSALSGRSETGHLGFARKYHQPISLEKAVNSALHQAVEGREMSMK